MKVRRHTFGRRTGLFGGALVASLALAGSSATGATAAPLYPQCPPVGNNQGCSELIVIPAKGLPTVQVDPAAPPAGYDGSEDTLIGVQNNSGKTVNSLNLASATQSIMGFDQDGLCSPSQWPSAPSTTPPGCPVINDPSGRGFGPTGYEGPNTSFSNISANEQTGTLNFIGGLPTGQTRYFALEEALTAGQLRSSNSGPAPGPVSVGHGHSVSFQLTCVGQQACNGKVNLIVVNKKGKQIGTAKLHILSGETVNVVVKLNKKGKKFLKKHHHLKVNIVAVIGSHHYLLSTVKL